jgi:hypothetical protein
MLKPIVKIENKPLISKKLSTPMAIAYEEESGQRKGDDFTRVCPKCGTWWVRRAEWYNQTNAICQEVRCTDKGAVVLFVHEHACGGRMVSEGGAL